MKKIELYNFLEEHKKEVLSRLTDLVGRERPDCKEMFAGRLGEVLENLYEGNLDFLVTDEIDTFDKLFQGLAPALAVKGSKFIEVYQLPLMMKSVVRSVLTEEYSKRNEPEGINELNTVLETAATSYHRAASQFLNIFQDYLQNQLDKGTEPAEAPQNGGIDLSKFVKTNSGEES